MARNGFDLGTAWVQIVPSMDGVAKTVEKELGGVRVDRASSGWADSISSTLGGALKAVGTIGVSSLAAVGAAVGGLAAGGGISRALSIENAQAKLTGLGHSAESVTAVMGSALESVKGTAYGLGDAATVAASLSASGVQEGDALTGVLKTVADTAQISGRSLTDIGTIFGSVAAKGKLQGDDMLQLMSSGVPVLQFLSQQLGVTTADVSEMVSKGQVDFATFASAMQAGLGGAALAAGETFQGAWANVQAALSRSGASLMAPVLEGLRVVFVGLAPAIDSVTAAFKPLAEGLGERVQTVASGIAAALGPVASGIAQVSSVLNSGAFIGGALAEDSGLVDFLFNLREGGTGLSTLIPIVGSLAGALGPLVSEVPVVGRVFGALSGPVGLVIGLFTQMFVESSTLRDAVGGLFGALGSILLSAAPILTLISDAVAQLAGLLGDALGQAISTVTPILTQVATTVFPVLQGVLAALLPVVMQIVSSALPVLGTILAALAPLMSTVLAALAPLIDALGPILTPVLELIAALLTPLTSLLSAILTPIVGLVSWIVQLVAPILEWGAAMAGLGIDWLAGVLTDLLVPAIQWLSDAITNVIGWFSTLGTEGSDSSNALTSAWTGVTGFFTGIWDGIAGAFTWAWESIIQPVIGALGAAFLWLNDNVFAPVGAGIQLFWDSTVAPVFNAISGFISGVLVPAFQFLWSIVSWVFEAISAVIQVNFAVVSMAFSAIATTVRDVLAAVFSWLYESVILPVWSGIQSAIQAVSDWWTTVLVPAWQASLDAWGAIFSWIYANVILPVWNGIQAAVQGVSDWWANTVVPAWQASVDGWGAIFRWVYDNVIQPVWSGIQSAIGAVGDWFQNNVVGVWQLAINAIGNAFSSFQSSVEAVWKAIQDAAKAPIRFVVETVYRDGIKATFDNIAQAVGLDTRLPDPPSLGFASGGILPGYTPGRDVHRFYSPTGGRLDLSGGEAIMRPEFTRFFGPAGIAALNAAARTGRLAGLVGGQAFADGGIWEAIGGTFTGAGTWLSSIADKAAKIISDPLGAIRELIVTPMQSALAGMGGGVLGDIAGSALRKAVDGIGEWFKGLLAPVTAGAGGNWVGGNTLQRLLPYIQATGTIITDTYRDPAYNAAVGGVPSSYHLDAANPAVDVSGSLEAMWAFYRFVMADPGGWRQVIWQQAGHYDHVHVAANGGVFGDLPVRKYDAGGWLQPGYTLALNETGRPEPIFTDSQWSALEARGSDGERVLVVVDQDGQLIGRMRVEAADVAVDMLREAVS